MAKRDKAKDVSWGGANKPDKFPGYKCMSTVRRLTVCQGKMSGKHNVVPRSAANTTSVNMGTAGNHQIGEGVRNFRSCLTQHSGIKNDTRHALAKK